MNLPSCERPVDVLEARCPEHPNLPAAATCARCGRYYCVRCDPGAVTRRPHHCPACRLLVEAAAIPHGIGGWLLLPVLQLAVTFLVAAVLSVLGAFNLYRVTLGSKRLELQAHSLERFTHLSLLMLVGGLAAAGFVVYLLRQLFQHRRNVPALMTAFYALNAVIWTVDAGRFGALRSLPFAVLWIAYFRLSKRVRKTFVR